MIKIAENGMIIMTAGDDFKYPLFINAGSRLSPLRYIVNGTDKVYFSIMEANQPFEHGIVRKIFTVDDLNLYGDVMIQLSNSDTELLLPGKYYYEIRLAYSKDGKNYYSTIASHRKFDII